MRNLFYFISALISFSGCTSHQPTHSIQADKVVNSYLKDVKSENELYLFGRGGGMIDDIKTISLTFLSYENKNIENVRLEIVQNVENLLIKINESIEVRPYLHEYPFTPNVIYFCIIYCFPLDPHCQPLATSQLWSIAISLPTWTWEV